MDLSKEKSCLEEMVAPAGWLMQVIRRNMDEIREQQLGIALSQHAAQRSRPPRRSQPVPAFPPRSPYQVEERSSSQPPVSVSLQRRQTEPSSLAKETVWNVVLIQTSA